MAFAWYSAVLICGQCHYAMHGEVSKNDIPVEYRVQCRNSKCENFGKLFRVDPACAIQLIEITDAALSDAVLLEESGAS